MLASFAVIARCPACSQLFPVLESARLGCPSCGARLDVEISRSRAEERDDPQVARVPPPWDEGAGPRFARLGETLRGVLLDPTRFFRRLAFARMGGSLSFLAVVMVPAWLVQSMALYFFLTSELGVLSGLPRVRFVDASVLTRVFILSPLVGLLVIAYLTTFYQAATAIACSKRPDLRATIRGTCFGFAPMVVAVVPVVGLPIGLVWSFILHAIAIRELHGINSLEAAGVVSMPLVVLVLHFVYV